MFFHFKPPLIYCQTAFPDIRGNAIIVTQRLIVKRLKKATLYGLHLACILLLFSLLTTKYTKSTKTNLPFALFVSLGVIQS